MSKPSYPPFFDLLSDSSQRLSNTLMMIGLLFVSFAIGNAFGGEFAYGDSRMILDLLGGTTKSWFRDKFMRLRDNISMVFRRILLFCMKTIKLSIFQCLFM